MLDATLLAKFWKDFKLVTQEADPNYPIVNPQDVARALIKCRNWVGTFTELLIATEARRTEVLKSVRQHEALIEEIEAKFYVELLQEVAISSLKTKELARALLAERGQTHPFYAKTKLVLQDLQQTLAEIDSDRHILEIIVKRIEKTTDWIESWLNWHKYEIRLQQ